MGTSADKFQYLADTKDLIKTAIIGKGQTVSSGDTFRSYATKIGNISSECTAIASNILSGKTAYSGGSKITGTIPSKGAQTYSPSTSAQTIASGQYLSGTQTISAVTGTAYAGVVLSGYTFNSGYGVGLTGTMTNRGAVTSTITTQGGQYTVPGGYHNGSGKVTASFANLSAGNVKKGVNVGGVVGTYGSAYETSTLTFRGVYYNSTYYNYNYATKGSGNSIPTENCLDILSASGTVLYSAFPYNGVKYDLIAGTTFSLADDIVVIVAHGFGASSYALDKSLYFYTTGSSGLELLSDTPFATIVGSSVTNNCRYIICKVTNSTPVLALVAV